MEFLCFCCSPGRRLSNRLSRQSLACIEFHWFMFHMRDESERKRERELERESGSVLQLPHGLWAFETLEDSEARLRSGDNAVITSFEYFTLSLSLSFPSLPFRVFVQKERDATLSLPVSSLISYAAFVLAEKYAREMINFWLKAQRWAPVFGMSLIGNAGHTQKKLYELCVYPVSATTIFWSSIYFIESFLPNFHSQRKQ